MDAITTVRFATMDDVPAICTIYNQGIDDRVATLETGVIPMSDVAGCPRGGRATPSSWPRDEDRSSAGAACFPTNKAGVALYERMGFAAVGTYREQGLLDGRWVDVLIMERLLG